MTSWGPGPGDFRDVPEFFRRLAAEMGFGPPPPAPPRPPRPPHPPGRERGPGGPHHDGPRHEGPRRERPRREGPRDEFCGPPWAGPWGPPWGRGQRRHRGSRAGRGDVRSAVLALLAEEPMHGYQMIQEIGRRSGGNWRPSPGSVYPTLQQLQDEGLVRSDEQDGRRVYQLTEDGQHHVADRQDEFADLWDGMAPPPDDDGDGGGELGGLVLGVASAFFHVMRTGSARQIEQARAVLARTRSELYRILGEDGAGTDDEPTDSDDDDGGEEDQP